MNVKTTQLLDRLLVGADKLSPEELEVLKRFDDYLDALYELSSYQKAMPDSDDWDIACREFCEAQIDTFLHG